LEKRPGERDNDETKHQLIALESVEGEEPEVIGDAKRRNSYAACGEDIGPSRKTRRGKKMAFTVRIMPGALHRDVKRVSEEDAERNCQQFRHDALRFERLNRRITSKDSKVRRTPK
jgi:hypothetical protein